MFDPFFSSRKNKEAESGAEKDRLMNLSKGKRYLEYQRIKGAIYHGREVSAGEKLFYQAIKAKYNAVYRGVHKNDFGAANRIREVPPPQYRSAYVKVLAREIGDREWREGEIVPWEDRGWRLRKLQSENPTMEFSWEV
jgi:hypothetical protein